MPELVPGLGKQLRSTSQNFGAQNYLFTSLSTRRAAGRRLARIAEVLEVKSMTEMCQLIFGSQGLFLLTAHACFAVDQLGAACVQIAKEGYVR